MLQDEGTPDHGQGEDQKAVQDPVPDGLAERVKGDGTIFNGSPPRIWSRKTSSRVRRWGATLWIRPPAPRIVRRTHARSSSPFHGDEDTVPAPHRWGNALRCNGRLVLGLKARGGHLDLLQGAGQEFLHVPHGGEAAGQDDADPVAHDLDIGNDVRREENGAALLAQMEDKIADLFAADGV